MHLDRKQSPMTTRYIVYLQIPMKAIPKCRTIQSSEQYIMDICLLVIESTYRYPTNHSRKTGSVNKQRHNLRDIIFPSTQWGAYHYFVLSTTKHFPV